MPLGEAADLAERRGHDGIGLAFYPGCGVVAIDLDKCKAPDGGWRLTAAQKAALDAFKRHSFIEASMSGTGVHAVALGDAETLKANGEVELFADRNFLALTGQGIGRALPLPAAALDRVREVVSSLRAARVKSALDATGASRRTLNADILADARAQAGDDHSADDAVSALHALAPPESYEGWRDLVWAFRAAVGSEGYAVARDWSATDPEQFDARAFDTVWNSFKPLQGGITERTLFRAARVAGWKPQAPGAEAADATSQAQTIGFEAATDAALAKAFAAWAVDRLKFDHSGAGWLHYDGARWAVCDLGQEVEALKSFACELFEKAADAMRVEPDGGHAKRLTRMAMRAQSASGVKATLLLAQSDPALATSSGRFDRDRDALNVANGVLDLRTGTLTPHSPAQLCKRVSPVAYDPGARSARWETFVQGISCGDDDWVGAMQTALGYCLTGHVREERLFFWFGSGRNGKSVLANVVRHVLGEYAATAPATMFLQSRRDAGGATPELAMLVGVRLLLANETEAGASLSEQMVKVAVSTEHIAARRLYGDPFSFAPSHKVVIRGNHLPIVRSTDEGIWRRIDLVPFDLKLTAEEADPGLEAALIAEAPAILAWMVEGAKRWYRDGLRSAKRTREAGAAYRKDSDLFAQWLDECCTRGPGREVTKAAAYASYRQWSQSQGISPMTRKSFGRAMVERGVGSARQGGGPRAEVYAGIALLA